MDLVGEKWAKVNVVSVLAGDINPVTAMSTVNKRRGSHIEEIVRDANVLHPSDDIIRNASSSNPDFGGLNADSQDATIHETSMTTGKAIKLYRKAICWSILLSTAIVMEGYDIVLVSNLYGLPSFSSQFGNAVDPKTGHKTVSASWRAGIGNGALVGQCFGLLLTGVSQERYGYKKTIGGALGFLIAFVFITFFARDLGTLLAGEMLCGVSWGVFQSITTAYASEVTPVALRAYVTTYVNFCWVLGQLIASGTLRGTLNLGHSEWGWRIPFGLQWIWPCPLILACYLCPESPWWLVRQGRLEDAKMNLLRLVSADVDEGFDPDKTLAMMQHTNEIEREMSRSTSYLQCFRGYDLRRTEIVCGTWLVQTMTGAMLMGYSTVFFEEAGLPVKSSFDLSLGQYGLGICGTLCSWFLMSKVGRRTIYLAGTSMLCLVLLTTGFLGIRKNDKASQWAAGSMLLLFAFVYDLSVGPVCFSLVAEMPSTRLKAKTIVLGRVAYNIVTIVVIVLINYQLTPTAWAWGAYSGFFWAGSSLLCVIWIYFRLPEPRNRTYGELDVLFQNRIPARQFKGFNVDIFRGYAVAVVESDEHGQPRRESIARYVKAET